MRGKQIWTLQLASVFRLIDRACRWRVEIQELITDKGMKNRVEVRKEIRLSITMVRRRLVFQMILDDLYLIRFRYMIIAHDGFQSNGWLIVIPWCSGSESRLRERLAVPNDCSGCKSGCNVDPKLYIS